MTSESIAFIIPKRMSQEMLEHPLLLQDINGLIFCLWCFKIALHDLFKTGSYIHI
jgi:hypothetical protein